ncbi:bifunctional DNA-formamidopyrimidine glycosylase/DNA-(apurinic or apyrimidinic site) lyase [Gilvimarinus sp. F26214L]|uniref:bifunctional DNA-formamidopyrimidine glycosylase/DNA-(apurinic or apyrimidinic site) lyase n=1 Tax=Gilvimarinus sp. DZF01 TaxID=3461371 RepID=UPI00404529D3
MPELPEVETTRRGVQPHVVGQRIRAVVIRQHSLRWPIPADLPALLEGQEVRDLSRRAKYLIFGFRHGSMIVHLGMSGSLRLVPADAPVGKHDHVDFQLETGKTLRYMDPRRFGAVLWTDEPPEEHPLLRDLGPEPLSAEFTGELLFRKSRKRRIPVKTFIMDSKVVVGVGNIYANEALFLAGIRPGRAAGRLTRAESARLAEQIKMVLTRAIEAGGTTLRDFIGGDGKPGYFKQELFVYGRTGENCLNCRAPLKTLRLGQRATVYCARCQR